MNEHVWWYVARSSGLVAGVLVTASVLWGLALSTRATKRPKAGWVLDIHRYLGGSAVVYTGLHLIGLWADNYVRFGPKELFVPMASPWRPAAVSWGIAALYLLIAVEVTSLLKRHIPKSVWRSVHVSSFILLLAMWVHAIGTGSDVGAPAARWISLASAVAVFFLLVFRSLLKLRLVVSAAARTG